MISSRIITAFFSNSFGVYVVDIMLMIIQSVQTEVHIDFYTFVCYYISLMEIPADFIADCRALSPGSFFPRKLTSHDELTRVLTSTQPTGLGSFSPLTSFGRRVDEDVKRKYSFGYNRLSVCKDAEVTLLESLLIAQEPIDFSLDPEISDRRLTIFTLNDVAIAVKKHLKARTTYAIQSAPDFNLISHTISKFTAPDFVYPASRPGTIFKVPLEGSNGHFWFGRYATSAVSPEIREVLSSESAAANKGLLLNHEAVAASTTELLDYAITFDEAAMMHSKVAA